MKTISELLRCGIPDRHFLSLRLTFRFTGSSVRLASLKTVELSPPPSDPVTPGKRESGFWYELQDASSLTLYRRVAYDPLQPTVELPSTLETENARPIHYPVKQPRGYFVFLVPYLRQARDLVVYSSQGQPGPAREILRFTLRGGPQSVEVER